MSREHILVVCGVGIACAPFLGLPLSWLSIVLPVLGVLVGTIGVTLVLRRTSHHEEAPLRSTHE